MAFPASSRSETSCRRLDSATVRTRSSVKRLASLRRCSSFSIAYEQNAIESTTTPHRRAAGGRKVRGAPGHTESRAIAALTDTNRTVVRIHSCIRRCSTASREGVLKSRRPTTRASRRMLSES